MKAVIAGALVAVAAWSSAVYGQEWPQRTVRIVVPFGPGSTPDLVARIVGEKLQKRHGHPVIVENRPGAGGMMGTDLVAKAAPDGHTIAVSTLGPLVNNTMMYKRMPYDPFSELSPVTIAVSQPSVLVAAKDFPATTIQELVTLVKKNPGKHNYASIGNGSLSHLTMELLAQKTGIDIVHVVYPGSAQAITAILGGHSDMAVLPAAVVMQHVKAGKLKIVASANRSPLLPGVPSLKDHGLSEFEIDTWFGFVASSKTPKGLVRKIHDEIVAVLRDPEVKAKLNGQLMDVIANSPDEFSRLMHEERRRWKPIIEKTRISLD
jgi:tripartite-type tricarboxylate transporter receptor subunit TctC